MTRHGLNDATTDPAMIRHRWAAAPDANLGIACSRDCAVLDVDPRHDGDATLDQLERSHGPLPVTWTAKTGGGWHYFFRANYEIRNNAGQIGPGIDIRGSGGYVVAPPSRHISGNAYAWATRRAPGDLPLAVMPPWLIPGKQPKAGSKVAAPASCWRELFRNGVSEGARNATVARLTGHLLRRNIDPFVALELVTIWNAVRCKPPLDEQEVVKIVGSIAECEFNRRSGSIHGE
jgi:hypothetical protein